MEEVVLDNIENQEIDNGISENQNADFGVKGYEDAGYYRVKVGEYNGPIDLLFILIKQTKIDIKNIFISEVTNQFIEHMRELDFIDIKEAADFLVVAAQLLEFKSRMLLPCERAEFENGEQMSDRELLEKMIMEEKQQEFAMLRDASLKLMEQQQSNRFYKEADESVKDVRIIFNKMDIDSMVSAFLNMFAKIKQDTYDKSYKKEIKKDKFTVAEKLEYIRKVLETQTEVKLSQLFVSKFSRSELICIFQSILELLKTQEIIAIQEHAYDDITIIKLGEVLS